MRLVAVLLLVGLSGCSGCASRGTADAGLGPSQAWLAGTPLPPGGTPHEGGTLVVRAAAEPAGLNLLDDRFRDGWTVRITRGLVTQTLLEVDPTDYSLRGLLAERWEDSADHRTTRLTLREGRHFHDGSVVSAADVVATFAAVRDEKRPTASWRGDLAELDQVRALDERTVELSWHHPSPFVLRKLAQLPIFPAKALAGDWAALAASPVGSGPYRVDSWERGEKLTLVRAESWTGERPHLDRIVFRVVKDATVAEGLLERGEVDLFIGLQPGQWRAMEGPSGAWAWRGFQRLKSTDNSFSYIAWNQALPLFRDVHVRRALAHLYPAEVMARSVDLGLEERTSCPHFRDGARCDPSVVPLPFSLQAARDELSDAGFVDTDGDGVVDRDGVPLRFKFLVSTSSVRLGKLVPLFQEQLKAVGGELVAEPVDNATLSTRVSKRDFEAVSRLWTEFDADHDLTYIFHSSQVDAGSNFAGYQSPEADRLLEAIREEWNPERRHELERALHRQLFADQPYLFMTNKQSLDMAKLRVHGLTPSLVWYDLRRVWVDP